MRIGEIRERYVLVGGASGFLRGMVCFWINNRDVIFKSGCSFRTARRSFRKDSNGAEDYGRRGSVSQSARRNEARRHGGQTFDCRMYSLAVEGVTY
jgi:hypothetical protein